MQVFSYPEKGGAESGPNYCHGDNDGPAVCIDGKIGDRDPGDAANWLIWLDRGQGFNNHQTFLMGSNETVDSAQMLANPFFRAEWDEEALLPATVVQAMAYDPFGVRRGKTFEPRPIALLYRKEKQFADWQPRMVAAHSSESFVLDAGELTTAYFRVGFSGGKGAKVTLTYAESYYQKDER